MNAELVHLLYADQIPKLGRRVADFFERYPTWDRTPQLANVPGVGPAIVLKLPTAIVDRNVEDIPVSLVNPKCNVCMVKAKLSRPTAPKRKQSHAVDSFHGQPSPPQRSSTLQLEQPVTLNHVESSRMQHDFVFPSPAGHHDEDPIYDDDDEPTPAIKSQQQQQPQESTNSFSSGLAGDLFKDFGSSMFSLDLTMPLASSSSQSSSNSNTIADEPYTPTQPAAHSSYSPQSAMQALMAPSNRKFGSRPPQLFL